MYRDGHQVDLPAHNIDDALVPKPIEYHIHDRAQARLCDGAPAGDADISSEDLLALRDARRDATLCPDCQDRVDPRDVRLELYGMGRHTTAHLYAVPALEGLYAVRGLDFFIDLAEGKADDTPLDADGGFGGEPDYLECTGKINTAIDILPMVTASDLGQAGRL